jgi:hypothetical protein
MKQAAVLSHRHRQFILHPSAFVLSEYPDLDSNPGAMRSMVVLGVGQVSWPLDHGTVTSGVIGNCTRISELRPRRRPVGP